ncbi:MAG: hypothetical protein GEV03_27140 [Streptosporangiales bacterium]|nr:hypothetical protein [Streptosporangiales bacterium]
MRLRPLAVAVAVTVVTATLGLGTAHAADEAPGQLTVVGHEPLFHRGMNAAPAVYGRYLYVGNRTDGSDTCANGGTGCPHPHPGVLVVDTADPADPRVVGEIGPPDEGAIGQTSRELRVWPHAGLLMVMNFRCSAVIHACPPDQPDRFDIKFFDVRADPVNPPLVATYVPSADPHEMFLWVDPRRPGHALLYLSTPTGSTDPAQPNLIVTDISRARDGVFAEIVRDNWNHLFPQDVIEAGNLAVHSMGVSADGRRTYLAYLAGSFLALDSSEVAAGLPNPRLRLLTATADRPTWPNSEAHSAVQVPGRRLALTTDEVYGTLVGPDHGCPWGWMRLIDVRDPAHPRIVGEYKTAENRRSFCETPVGQDDERVSFASHNPTVLRNLALITWHSSGFQVVDVADSRRPRQAAEFRPLPLSSVATEDPALSLGPGKVVMWSYPIIRNGLIYVVDIRNGLYILRYRGPHAGEVARTRFLEGNSNLGDAV